MSQDIWQGGKETNNSGKEAHDHENKQMIYEKKICIQKKKKYHKIPHYSGKEHMIRIKKRNTGQSEQEPEKKETQNLG